MKQWYAYKRAVTGSASPDDANIAHAVKAYQDQINQLNTKIAGIVGNLSRTQSDLDNASKLAEQRNALQSRLDTLKEGKKEIDDGQATIAKEAADLLEKKKEGKPLVAGLVGASGHYAFASKAEAWMLDAYYGSVPNAKVTEFFDTLVHDSKAGFLGGHEPFAYFRNRGVWESANPNPVPSEQVQERRAMQN